MIRSTDLEEMCQLWWQPSDVVILEIELAHELQFSDCLGYFVQMFITQIERFGLSFQRSDEDSVRHVVYVAQVLSTKPLF